MRDAYLCMIMRMLLARPAAFRVLLAVTLAALLAATPASAATGPRIIRQLVAGPGGVDTSTFGVVGVLGSRVLFRADAANGIGAELWKTDGTPAGTKLVKDINTGIHGSSVAFVMVVRGSTGFVEATTDSLGTELWKTDGTPGGTRIVKDIAHIGSESSLAYPYALMGGNVYFSASDGSLPGEHGSELWRTNGTARGTRMVKNIAPGAADAGINNVASIGSKVLFGANDGVHGLELFVSDGTRGGTHQVKEINEEGDIIPYPGGGFTPVVIGGIYYFKANDGEGGGPGDHGAELWRSDGTPAGTRMVKDINPGVTSTNFSWVHRVGHRLFLAVTDGKGNELWVSDGTAGGTHRVKDIWPGSGSSNPYYLGSIGSTLYFAAKDGSDGHGVELWKSDGTAAGTKMVRDINSGPGDSSPIWGTVIGHRIYINAVTNKGNELWRSNGTRKGTRLVMDIAPGEGSSDPSWLTTLDNRLIFFADDGVHGEELWTYIP